MNSSTAAFLLWSYNPTAHLPVEPTLESNGIDYPGRGRRLELSGEKPSAPRLLCMISAIRLHVTKLPPLLAGTTMVAFCIRTSRNLSSARSKDAIPAPRCTLA